MGNHEKEEASCLSTVQKEFVIVHASDPSIPMGGNSQFLTNYALELLSPPVKPQKTSLDYCPSRTVDTRRFLRDPYCLAPETEPVSLLCRRN